MGKGNQILTTIVILALLVVIGFRYHQYMVAGNFTLYLNGPCDPNTQTCFASDCEIDDPECDSTPYAKVELAAKDAPRCLEEHKCESFSCDGLASCNITYCSDDSIEEGEKCLEVVLPTENVVENGAEQ